MRHAVAAVLTVLLSTGSAAADPDVAFVNICEDGKLCSAAIDRLRTPVLDHSGLEGIGAGPLRAALEQPLAGQTEVDLAPIESLRARAWDAYSAFDRDGALRLLGQARTALETVPMTDAVAARWFQIILLEGQIHMQAKRTAEATAAFRLATRLSPDTKLDPGVYTPETIRAYEAAAAAQPASVRHTLSTGVDSSRLWVDGRDVGPANTELELDVGRHLMAVTAPGYAPSTRIVDVSSGGDGRTEIELRRLPDDQQIPALRASLATEATPAAIATLAEITGTSWLVLLRQRDASQLEATVYDAANDTLGSWVPVETSGPLFSQLPRRDPNLSPKTAAGLVAEPPDTTLTTPHRPWYKTTTGVAAIVGTTALIAGGIALFFIIDRDDTGAIGEFCGLGMPCR